MTAPGMTAPGMTPAAPEVRGFRRRRRTFVSPFWSSPFVPVLLVADAVMVGVAVMVVTR